MVHLFPVPPRPHCYHLLLRLMVLLGILLAYRYPSHSTNLSFMTCCWMSAISPVLRRLKKLQHISRRQQEIRGDLTSGQRFLLEIVAEKGVSSWITVSPCWCDGTVMSKSDFCDAMCIRYDWRLPDLPKDCVGDTGINTSHAFTCPTGGYNHRSPQ